MRILAVSSQVAYGPVGNSAAVPALQAKGHEVINLPTVTLSHHPGHGVPSGYVTSGKDMTGMLDALGRLGVLAKTGAAMTGYFAAVDQIDAITPVLGQLKFASPPAFILVDPVFGDEGGMYVPLAIAEHIKRTLLPFATCITPNRFELEWLSGMAVTDVASATAAATSLGISEVLATSIPADQGMLTTLLVTQGATQAITGPKLTAVPNGTGDFLSGLYLAARVTGTPQAAFAEAMTVLTRAITLSAGTPVLDVAGALHGT
jgi:pyridoxine kinase